MDKKTIGIIDVVMALVMFIVLLIMAFCTDAGAVEVDMSIIASIESSNNPDAYNRWSKATGMYQITPICLEEYNRMSGANFALNDMFDADMCYYVANWYMNKRIPQMLRHYELEDSIENRLWAYNAGIGNVVKNRKPNESINYIRLYKKGGRV